MSKTQLESCDPVIVKRVSDDLCIKSYSSINGASNSVFFRKFDGSYLDCVFDHYEEFLKHGHHIFYTTVIEGTVQTQGIGIVRSTDILDSVRIVQTHGPTTSTEEVVTWLDNFMKSHSLVLWEVGVHWLTGYFSPPISDAMAFAREIEKVCPDMIEGDRNARKAVAEEMERFPTSFALRWQ